MSIGMAALMLGEQGKETSLCSCQPRKRVGMCTPLQLFIKKQGISSVNHVDLDISSFRWRWFLLGTVKKDLDLRHISKQVQTRTPVAACQALESI